MTRFTRRKVRLKFVAPVLTDPIWTITGGGVFNEGSNLTFTVHCNENSAVFTVGETIDVELIAQATPSPLGAWSITGAQMVQNAVDTLNAIVPGGVSVGSTSQIVRFHMDVLHAAGWNGNIVFTRPSVNKAAEAQGDFTGSWTITNITRGAGGGDSVAFTITDTFVAPPTGLTDFTFDTSSVIGGYDTITIPYKTAANTPIATSVTGVGAAVTSIAFATSGDDAGRFKLVGNIPYTNSIADFEKTNPYVPADVVLGGRAACYITLIANPGANQITKVFRIRPRFQVISPALPTGGIYNGIAPSILVYPNLKNWASGTFANASLQVSPSVVGVVSDGGSANPIQIPQATATLFSIDTRLFRGHKRISFGKAPGAMMTNFWGNDFTLEDMAFAAGGDPPYTSDSTLSSRDGLQIGNTPSRHVGTVRCLVLRCSFKWSIDELCQTFGYGPSPRSVRFSYCFFHSPLIRAGHAQGSHPFGPIISQGTMDIVYDKCFFLGLNQRSPYLHVARGCVVQNCVMALWGMNTSNGGTWLVTHSDTDGEVTGNVNRDEAHEMAAIIRANLYLDGSCTFPATGNPVVGTAGAGIPISGPVGKIPNVGTRISHIMVGNGTDQGQFHTKIYIPQGTGHDNHFFKFVSANNFDFTADPVLRIATSLMTSAGYPGNIGLNDARNQGITLDWHAMEPGCLTSYQPFETDMDSELMPTATLADRQALFADVWQNVGPRDDGAGHIDSGLAGMTFIDYEAMKNFLDTGTYTPVYGCFPNGPPFTEGGAPTGNAPAPSAATYDFTKCTQLPPGARAWSV